MTEYKDLQWFIDRSMAKLKRVWIQEIGDSLHVYEGGKCIAVCHEDDLDGVITDLNIGDIYLWIPNS